jgi:hypothetical protein
LAFNDFGTGFPSIAYSDFTYDPDTDIITSQLFFIDDPPAVVPEPATLLLVAWAVFAQGIGSRRRGSLLSRTQHSMLTAWNRSRCSSTPGFCT